MALSKTQKDKRFVEMLEEKYLECSLCQDTYKQPRSLTCLHSFCQQCLTNYIHHNPEKLLCPTCKKETTPPANGVEGLPPNFLLKSLADDFALFKKQTVKCSNCSADKTATMACADCTLYMCDECYGFHEGLKSIRESHHSFDIAGFADDVNLQQFQSKRFELCEEHKEPKKLFCRTDQIQICHTCSFTVDHRKHEVCFLQEEIDEVLSKIQTQTKQANDLNTKFNSQNKKMQEFIDEVRHLKLKSLADLQTEKNTVETIIKEAYQKEAKEITDSAEEVERTLKEKISINQNNNEKFDAKIRAQSALRIVSMTSRRDAAKTILSELKNICETEVQHPEEENPVGKVKQFVTSDLQQLEKLPFGRVENKGRKATLDLNERRKLPLKALILKVGDRVVRGPDWTYGHQDGNPPGPGTVIRVDDTGRTQVLWDAGHKYHYRMGADNRYDLRLE